jgi:signal transduction histidine kinase
LKEVSNFTAVSFSMNELRHRADLTYAALSGDNVLTMQAYFNDTLVCLYANAAFAAWCDKFPQQIEGRTKLPELMGKQYKYAEQLVADALTGKPQQFELSRPDPSGFGMRYTRLRLIPHTIFGKTKGLVIESEDITPVRQWEEQVRADSNVVVKQNERLLNFANIVTHNLMNYAASLETTLDLYKSGDADAKAELFQLIEDISAGLTGSLKTLGEVVKIPNMSHMPMERVNLHSYVLKATEVLQPQISATNALIRNSVDRDIHVAGIPAYIESIVYNLISNTIKYRHADRTPEVELNAIVVGNETVFSIRDNGIGIDLDSNRTKLYGLYQTFGNNTDASGIGLFIAKYQIDSMGGNIGVESEVGKGTEFRVYLKTKA